MARDNTSSRGVKALNAMKAIGIEPHVAKPVLKNLLKVYENNWLYIEAENYRVLADAILDMEESKEEEPKKKRNDEDVDVRKKDAIVSESSDLSRKRPRIKEEQEASPSAPNSDMLSEALVRRPRKEVDVSHQLHLQTTGVELAPFQTDCGGEMPKLLLPEASFREKGKKVMHPQHSQRVQLGLTQTSIRVETVEPIKLQSTPREKMTDALATRIDHRVTRASKKAADFVAQMGQEAELAASDSLITNHRGKRPMHERMDNLPKSEPSVQLLQRKGSANSYTAPIIPKDEPFDIDDAQFAVPIAMICPSKPVATRNQAPHHANKSYSSIENSTLQGNCPKTPVPQYEIGKSGKESISTSPCTNGTLSDIVKVQEASPKNVEIASSSKGGVKISLSCSSDRKDFQMPSLETVFKLVEDKCLHSYKILQPDFSLMNIMTEVCETFLNLGSGSAEEEGDIINVIPLLDSLKKSSTNGILGGMAPCIVNDLPLPFPQAGLMGGNGPHQFQKDNQKNEPKKGMTRKQNMDSDTPDTTSNSLVFVQQQQLALSNTRPLHDVNDISKGEERVRISLVNEVNSEKYPPCFYYISRNITYQNAYLNFSLARIGDEDCCSDCFGDCLAFPIPCACARETGGEYAYTSEGLVKKEFLEECISMNRDPEKHHHFYCKDCPLERSKNEVLPDPCKGHPVRKFIKECWSKCGCNKQCGNRVVQRGIACNLQVFYTAEGKGWGVRTLDELPRGAFVCEYVGEVLTNMELYDRTVQKTGNAKHTYPVLLDADWGSEGVLKDEEALCLDATFYGNIGRFVNHRCYDANLVEIPVEVETPDHHYYHLAFFTTRKIEAFEELTWDYGIDFDDHDHPIKAFRCRCGSKFCRDAKRPGPKSGALVLR